MSISQFAFSLESYLFSPIKNWSRHKRNISGKFTLVSLFQISDKLFVIKKHLINSFILGRGFVLWEPHLEVSKVLLGLLDMASEADKWVPSQKYALPLTPGK